MKNKLKEMKGITLIALVITIIVLLILAGVSIAMLTGENGILTQATNAKEQTQKAEAEEMFKLIANEWQIEKEKGTSLETFIDRKNIQYELEQKGDYGFKIKYNGYENIVTIEGKIGKEAVVGKKVNESNEYYINNGIAKIPVGYMIVPGCDDISEGLVISDNPADTEEDPNNIVANGNQFVWIPVTDESKYKRNISYANTSVSATAKDDTDYLPEGITDEKQAVLNAGGFYIGRYTGENLVCKKGVAGYIRISQTDAKAKAKTFIADDNNKNVKSGLITGIQWDVAMSVINSEPRKDGNGNTYDVTKTSSDRHTSSRECHKFCVN